MQVWRVRVLDKLPRQTSQGGPFGMAFIDMGAIEGAQKTAYIGNDLAEAEAVFRSCVTLGHNVVLRELQTSFDWLCAAKYEKVISLNASLSPTPCATCASNVGGDRCSFGHNTLIKPCPFWLG